MTVSVRGESGMNANVARSLKADTPEKAVLTHVEAARILVGSRHAALDLTVDQIRELAAAVLILDQQLEDANRRMAAMILAEAEPPVQATAKPGIVHVPLMTGGDPKLAAALEALVKARRHLEANRFSSEENQARKALEKAAFAVADITTPKQRT
ncbi:hypothetical protein HPDFL43_14802 [Hoeflea phototrophica DFL-43]|jgi:hypothetical protein|uniref:Uncharacterized protein n=1 Tax=Hoeflea phototrophica (strain DSM 17068 / NCIMB 14078 / DFL-43) TaxID=411684 RepID=A9D2U6_HOEPD|nr:hypothetical protein [Hoeflea phototrophica]EDQ34276.1 hypothetical protein HPDFL43_14802 [Hoeflea phototrophica DFL-43]